VAIANWTHLNDLTIDQLQAFVLIEDAGFDHLVIFGRGKAPRVELNRHLLASAAMIAPVMSRPTNVSRRGRALSSRAVDGHPPPGRTAWSAEGMLAPLPTDGTA
jgi:hypothetical protein